MMLCSNLEMDLKCKPNIAKDINFLNLYEIVLELPCLGAEAYLENLVPVVCRGVALLPVESQAANHLQACDPVLREALVPPLLRRPPARGAQTCSVGEPAPLPTAPDLRRVRQAHFPLHVRPALHRPDK